MGLFYEEFRVGQAFETAGAEIDRERIAAFAELTGDDNPLHTDADYARAAGFPDLLAHGPLVQAVAIGLIADTGIMSGTTIALLALSARFHAPVFAGDRVHVRFQVTRKRPTRSPERGLLWRRADVIKQDGTVAITLALTALVRRRPAA